MTAPNWELGPDSKAVLSLFEASLAGNRQVTFAAVEAAAGKSRHELAGAIGTARRRMVRDHGVEFINVRGVGYRALADAGQADAGQRDISRVGRITRRRRKRMELADVTKLSADERVLHYGTSAQLALIGDAASLRATKKVDDIVKGTHNLSVEEQRKSIEIMLDMWKKKI
jgi:hypothetical protein